MFSLLGRFDKKVSLLDWWAEGWIEEFYCWMDGCMGRRMEFRSCMDLLMMWGLMSSADILGTIHRHSDPPPHQKQTKTTTTKNSHKNTHKTNKQTTTKQQQTQQTTTTTTTTKRGEMLFTLGKESSTKPVQYVHRVGTLVRTETGYLVLGLVHIETGTVRTSCWDCGPHRNWLSRVETVAHTETGYLVLGLWHRQKLVTLCWDCGPHRNLLPCVGTGPHRNRYMGLWPTT